MASSSTTMKVEYEFFYIFPLAPFLSNEQCQKCKICNKMIKYSLSTKGNLLNHLQTAHSQQLKEQQDAQLKAQSSNVSIDPYKGFLQAKPFARQEQLTRALVKNLIAEGPSISIVAQNWFRSFMSQALPKYKIPAKDTIISVINSQAIKSKDLLIKQIQESQCRP